MRILLTTGKGGVGKTSVAAATALRCADAGLRTLVLSTDPAHSLADALDVPIGARPTPVEAGLDAVQLDAQQHLEDNWREIRAYLVALLRWSGIGEVEAEELAVLPGLEEVLSLIDLLQHAESGAYDVLVVDCAPTAETLRLLSLPDALGWYMERVFPIERKVARALRPVLGRMTTMPLPEDALMGAAERLYRNLERVRELLVDPEVTTVRLVVNAEKVVVAEALRTATYLGLFGYAIDAVVVNRLLPDEVADPWFDRWRAAQATHLATVREGFGDVPVLVAPLHATELVGAAALRRLGDDVFRDAPGKAHEVLHRSEPLRFERTADGWTLAIALPFVDRADVDAFRRADELYVKVGSYTRSVVLPAALRRCDVASAALAGDELVVRFVARPEERAPDPDRPR